MKKQFVNFMLIAFCAVMSVSCGNAAHKRQNVDTAMTIDSTLLNAENLVGNTITIEGFCTHTCRHGARKIFLMGSDDTQTLRVEASPKQEKGFSPDCIKNMVRVSGRLVEQRIDEAYLKEWESQAVQHESAEQGCSTERQARQEQGNTVAERIADFRRRMDERRQSEGKDYLSFYYLVADSYEVVK